MCDALSRNVPKLPTVWKILLANCLAHGRRQFVEVAANFPDECRYVLEMLGQVYGHDAEARERGLSPDERLRFHQEHSGPVMERAARLAGSAVRGAQDGAELRAGQGDHLSAEPLAEADAVSAAKRGRHWTTTSCERALKKAVLHRKNALFYKTLNGGAGGRPVHEPDPHLRTQRRQSIRLPDRVAAARRGTGGEPVGVDALELPRDDGAAASAAA